MTPNRKASDILAKRRDENKRDQENRIKEVYSKIPKMKSLEAHIKELGFTAVSKGLTGSDTSEIENEVNRLIAFKYNLLERNGFPTDYMEIRYHHEPCKDTGFIGTEMCSCRKQLIIDENYSQSNIRNLILKENFDNFDESLFSDNPFPGYGVSPLFNIRSIRHKINYFIENFDKQTKNIYIFGDVGRGKTYILNSIAKEILDRNFSVLYMTSSSLFKFLNDYNWAFEDQRAKHEDQYNFILNCDLLIIDDLGTEPSTKNDSSNLLDVVNSRMIAGKPIIFSTNFDETMLSDTYGPRIFSRIVGNSEVYEIFGEDLRLKGMD